jgi:WD40 repeat protein/serine/threonine protein kinase/tetratricopeptide (TPR) repeat protein
MSDSSADRNPVEELAEEFLERFRQGERPSLSEYTRQFPALAEEIRELFPALVMLEDVRPAGATGSKSPSGSANATGGKKLERLGDYRILREVGRGGMGIVYEAEQESLGRHVALKVLPSQALLDPRHLQRFQREAKAAARLHHTNIVPVFGVGEQDGLHYYVMQFIQGQGLEQVLAVLQRLRGVPASTVMSPPIGQGSAHAVIQSDPSVAGPMSFELASAAIAANSLLTGIFALPKKDMQTARQPDRETDEEPSAVSLSPSLSVSLSSSEVHLPGQTQQATLSHSGQPYWHSVARIGIQVADALAYAHGQGTLHRDIKPSNLLLDTQGIVWVTDFGLAKANDSEDLTHTGDVVGTLRYMAPERFKGHADARSDIYALGLTLYELLTLRPAFDASERNRLFLQVMSIDPPRPRKVNPAVPRDLETIVCKAVARDPGHRYQSAAEMAEDLKRFTDDKPIRARPVSEMEKAWRWCRRNPAMALLAAACLMTLALGLAGITWKWREAEGARQRESDAERQTAIQRDDAVGARNDTRRVLAGVMLDRGITLAEQAEIGEGLFWMLEALRAVPEDAHNLERLIRTNLAAWMGQAHVVEHLIGRSSPAKACAFSPDGKQFVTVFDDGVRAWDTATGRPVGSRGLNKPGMLALSPDGRRALTVSTWDEGKPCQVQRWDTDTSQPIGGPLQHPLSIDGGTFVPGGKQFVTACADGLIRVWDFETGRLIHSFAADRKRVRSLAISPDGTTLAAACQDTRPPDYLEGPAPCVVSFWELTGRKRLAPSLLHGAMIRSIAWSPDGKNIVTGGWDGSAQVWDTTTGKPVGPTLRHPNPVNVVRFTPDGRTIVTGGPDGVTRWWDVVTAQQLVGTLTGNKIPVRDLAFSPDGRRLVIAQGGEETGQIVVCRLAHSLSRPAVKGKEAFQKADWVVNSAEAWFQRNFAAISPDATRVIAGGQGYARLFDVSTGQPAYLTAGGPFRHDWLAVDVTAFSPDGRFFASASRGEAAVGDARLWEAATGRLVGAPLSHSNYVSALAFTADGKILATGDYDRLIRFWDTATGNRIGSPFLQVDIVIGLAFSPDGKTLAAGLAKDYSRVARVVLWDVATRRQIGQPLPVGSYLLRFSPDGNRLLTAGGFTFQLWDTVTARPLGAPISESAEINCVKFRPDGKMILIGSTDGTLRLRDGISGKLIGAPMLHTQRVKAAGFSPDPEGRLIVAGYGDGSARLWDRATQKPIGTPVIHGGSIVAVSFTPDGRSFVTVSNDGTPRRWPVPAPVEASLETLTLRLQARTGLTMREQQIVVPLSAVEWTRCTEQLAALKEPAERPPAASVSDRDFHDARARDNEQAGVAFATLWHLDRLIAGGPHLPATFPHPPATFPHSPATFPHPPATFPHPPATFPHPPAPSPKEGEGETRAPHPPTPSPRAGEGECAWLAYARRARCHAGQGHIALAELDYAQAQALGSSEQLINWYHYCIVDCLARKQWETALWYCQRVIPAAPDDWQLYADRALAHQQLGHTPERQADLDHILELKADTTFLLQLTDEYAGRALWGKAAAVLLAVDKRGDLPVGSYHTYALACLKTGDRARYRMICGRLLERFGQTQIPDLANFLAWISSVGPDALDDYAEAITLGELAVNQAESKDKRVPALNTLGAVLYRAGRYREAIARLREGMQASKGQGGIHDWVFLAMAHHRQGETAEARKYLDKATQFRLPEKASPWGKLEVEMLRREAAALINGKAGGVKK